MFRVRGLADLRKIAVGFGEHMVKSKTGVGRGVCWRNLLIAACAGIATLWTSAANATITQGDFSVFGFFETREAGRWGEGGSNGANVPTTFTGGSLKNTVTHYGWAASSTGGSFDFNHWDLVEMRQLADIRPDYHMVKNYKFMGRLDTLVLKDADFFAFYRPWYDAFGSLKDRGVAQADRDFNLDEYNQHSIQQEYVRNDLREFYAPAELYRQLLDACRKAAGHLVGSRCAVRH